MLVDMMRSRGVSRRRRGVVGVGLSSVIAAACWIAAPSSAEASVSGRRGIEIEGAQDRRGFYVGAGLGFGGTFFWYDDFIPATRLDLALGGGVTERFTLGVDLHLTPYLQRGVGVAFGGDIEATGYVWRGLYLRGGLGASGVPKRNTDTGEDTDGLTVGLGGAFSAGYEFFLNSTAAMGAGITYDARVIPGDTFPRQTLLVGARFSWF
jgi:hypothetical protein